MLLSVTKINLVTHICNHSYQYEQKKIKMANTENQQNTSLKEFKIMVNENEISFTQPKVSGKQILEKACKEPIECYTLYQKLKGCDFEKILHHQDGNEFS